MIIKRKTLLWLVLAIVICMMGCCFVGCSVKGGSDGSSVPNGDVKEDTTLLNNTVSDRKIVYTSSLSITVDDVFESGDILKTKLNSDEWIEYSYTNEYRASFTLRIKTSRLDDFVESLESLGTVSNYQLEATDISLSYYNNVNAKTALETEQATLLRLLEDATSIQDVLEINKRLSAIEVELRQITGTINGQESLMEYSKVTVILSVKNSQYEETFGEKLAIGFGIILDIAEFFLIVLICVSPLLIIAGSIVAIVLVANKKKKKKNNDNNKTDINK